MRGFRLLPFISLFACLADSCKNQPAGITQKPAIDTQVVAQKNGDSVLKKTKSLRYVLPPHYVRKAAYYFEKYTRDTVGLGAFLNWELFKDFEGGDFEGVKLLGHLRNSGRPDSVFILSQLCATEEGQSYYFSDTSIPRINTPSYCCHPENIFLVGDIDEDGISEIGQYLSSCVSRYKALLVWSLKNNEWKKVGECLFDISYPDPTMNKRFRMTGKGRFEMLEVSGDLVHEQRNWKQFRF